MRSCQAKGALGDSVGIVSDRGGELRSTCGYLSLLPRSCFLLHVPHISFIFSLLSPSIMKIRIAFLIMSTLRDSCCRTTRRLYNVDVLSTVNQSSTTNTIKSEQHSVKHTSKSKRLHQHFIIKPTAILGMLLASTAFAILTVKRQDGTSHLKILGLGDQGDGFYRIITNDKGESEVKFTPMADLNFNATTPEVVTKRDLELSKRGGNERGSHCQGWIRRTL